MVNIDMIDKELYNSIYVSPRIGDYKEVWSRIKNNKEVIGQIPRLIFGGVKSFVGKIPIGNPGGANVPPLKPFEISEELKEVFKKADISLN